MIKRIIQRQYEQLDEMCQQTLAEIEKLSANLTENDFAQRLEIERTKELIFSIEKDIQVKKQEINRLEIRNRYQQLVDIYEQTRDEVQLLEMFLENSVSSDASSKESKLKIINNLNNLNERNNLNSVPLRHKRLDLTNADEMPIPEREEQAQNHYSHVLKRWQESLSKNQELESTMVETEEQIIPQPIEFTPPAPILPAISIPEPPIQEIPSIPVEPEAPLVPDISEPPMMPSMPDIPEPPIMPLVLDVPEPSLMPLVPEIPEPPLMPSVPDIPEPPLMPLVPDIPEPPMMPLAPGIPEIPMIPDIPETPMASSNEKIGKGKKAGKKAKVAKTQKPEKVPKPEKKPKVANEAKSVKGQDVITDKKGRQFIMDPSTPPLTKSEKSAGTSIMITFVLVLVIGVLYAGIVSVLNADAIGESNSILGKSFITVNTLSMEPTIGPGAVMMVDRNVDPNDLEIGDIVVFMRPNEEVIVNRLYAIHQDFHAFGSHGYRLIGDASGGFPDGEVHNGDMLVGSVMFSNTLIGQLLLFGHNFPLFAVMFFGATLAFLLLLKGGIAPKPKRIRIDNDPNYNNEG